MQQELFKQFFGRRILLTGHTGFKGSWLALWLQQLGAEVIGVAQEPPTNPSHFEVANVADHIDRSIIGDIRDEQLLADLVCETKPDLIMHLAAQSVVKTGYENPVETFSTNVMGTVHVLEAIRVSKRPCAALIVTSDKCYENIEQTWGYRECDPMGDHDPYGGSKGAAELVVRSYRHSFFPTSRVDQHGVWLASARAGNVIGGGDWTANALVVDTFKAMVDGRPVQIRSPHSVRPWQHVLQCLSGYLTIAAKLLKAQDKTICSGWNVGPHPGNELTVKEVVEHFIDCCDQGEWEDVSDPNQLREAGVLRLSIDKALTDLQWQPTWDVYMTIQKTAEWYQRYTQSPNSMQAFSLSQIEQFQEQMFALGAADKKPPIAIPGYAN